MLKAIFLPSFFPPFNIVQWQINQFLKCLYLLPILVSGSHHFSLRIRSEQKLGGPHILGLNVKTDLLHSKHLCTRLREWIFKIVPGSGLRRRFLKFQHKCYSMKKLEVIWFWKQTHKNKTSYLSCQGMSSFEKSCYICRHLEMSNVWIFLDWWPSCRPSSSCHW